VFLDAFSGVFHLLYRYVRVIDYNNSIVFSLLPFSKHRAVYRSYLTRNF